MKARLGSVGLLLILSAAQASSATGQPVQAELTSAAQRRLTCSLSAAQRQGVPPHALLAVATLEGGRPGQWSPNRNGSYDVGSMQFNTRYLRVLERRHGITAADVAAEGCYPFELAAWRLRQHLDNDSGDFWTRIANYHSRTPAHNAKYRRRLMRSARRWVARLSARGIDTGENADRRGTELAAVDPPAVESPGTSPAIPPRLTVVQESSWGQVLVSPGVLDGRIDGWRSALVF